MSGLQLTLILIRKFKKFKISSHGLYAGHLVRSVRWRSQIGNDSLSLLQPRVENERLFGGINFKCFVGNKRDVTKPTNDTTIFVVPR